MKTNIYAIMSPTSIPEVHTRIARYLPDAYRSPEAFYALYTSRTTMVFEVGDFQGTFWLTDIIVGWKAGIHAVLWDKQYLGKSELAKAVLADLMRLLKLQRLEAFIPVTMRAAGRYAERVGFKFEGILRRAAYYDGQLVDLAAYSIIKGEE